MIAAAPDFAARDIDLRLRQALLRADREGAILQETIDVAELLAVHRHDAPARALFALASLRIGLGPAGLAWQAAVAARLGLWPDVVPDAGVAPPPGFSVDLAIEELRGLLALDVTSTPLSLEAAPPAQPELEKTVCERLVATLLAWPTPAAAGPILRGFLAEPVAAIPAPLAERLDEPVAEIAGLLVLRETRRYLAVHGPVIAAGATPALFARAVALDPAALGPCFANVRHIIRDARDVMALIAAAADDGKRLDDLTLGRWCVLLSGGFGEADMLSLIDELGDRGLVDALGGMLSRAAWGRSTPLSRTVAAKVRDVAIDLGEWPLAEAAQRLRAEWAPDRLVEWQRLGDLLTPAGDEAGARAAYARGLALDPLDASTQARRAALDASPLERRLVTRGLGTPPDRQRLRRLRVAAWRTR